MMANRFRSRLARLVIPVLVGVVVSGCNSSGNSAATPVSAVPTGTNAPGGTSGIGSAPSGGTGSVTVSWLAPDRNTDGSALTNLAGFYIRYGIDKNVLNQVVKIATTGLSNYVIQNLSPDTWYFTVTSYTTAGVESEAPAAVSKIIN
jgi:hypothetical protein